MNYHCEESNAALEKNAHTFHNRTQSPAIKVANIPYGYPIWDSEYPNWDIYMIRNKPLNAQGHLACSGLYFVSIEYTSK